VFSRNGEWQIKVYAIFLSWVIFVSNQLMASHPALPYRRATIVRFSEREKAWAFTEE
jgi:hypothetical protein